MDQKNTIVKCYANPNCLFNHNGICDNYVISIGSDGSCQEYIETITEEEIIYENAKKMLKEAGITLIEPKGEVKRGQRAKGNFLEDSCHQCSSACEYHDFQGGSLYCQLKQQYLGPEQLMKPCDLFKLFLPTTDTETSVTMFRSDYKED